MVCENLDAGVHYAFCKQQKRLQETLTKKFVEELYASNCRSHISAQAIRQSSVEYAFFSSRNAR